MSGNPIVASNTGLAVGLGGVIVTPPVFGQIVNCIY